MVKVFLEIGNFCQAAPVVHFGGKTETINMSVVSQHLWHWFSLFCICKPIHNTSDFEYVQQVDNIGQGTVGLDEAGKSLYMNPNVHNIYNFSTFLYPLKRWQMMNDVY